MTSSPTMLHILPSQMETVFRDILLKNDFSPEKATATATIFIDNALDGIYTHSVNRFAKFIQYVQNGYVKPDQQAVLKNTAGCIEQWDGKSGVGVLNALQCTDRAMLLATQHGLGCVALAHTNHWMRGGAYGWKAAKKGFAFIGWTNTLANTPAWGAVDSKLGNNPLVMAVPYNDDAIVLDMAMSQYSYGAMELHKLKGEKLPVPGGYDVKGNLSDDPEAIMESRRTLPVGYWKGSGLSLLLDLLATILSGGLSVSEITKLPAEMNVSQVFIAVDLSRLNHHRTIPELIHRIIEDYHNSVSEKSDRRVRYPGERILATRKENSERGIPVLPKVWAEIQALQ
jgi:3-dehydro-L-gulonate 2-dehydrogenase